MKGSAGYRRNIKISLGIFLALFAVLICYLGYAVTTYGEKWFATPYNTRLQNAAGIVRAGTIYDRNGEKLAWTEDGKRNYSSDRSLRRAVSHVVGDNLGKSIGAETMFAKYLLGFEKNVADRLAGALAGDDKRGSDITLTIDADLSDHIYDELNNYSGAVAVINYKTGEIIALVSSPNFDPTKLSNEDIEDTSLVNRATMGKYPPGSTMKILTAACAIENNIDFEYECTGSTIINGQKVSCPGGEAHGKLDLQEAFQVSCNTYFATLSVRLGNDKLEANANKFAYNTEFNFSDIILYSSSYEGSGDDGNVAWAGIGLYNDLITPLHSAMITGAVANGGVMMEPKLLKKVDENNALTSSVYRTVMSSSVAEKLEGYMRAVVTDGTGTRADVSGVTVCGKTGTADYVEDGKTKSHAWFTGYIADDEYPYAVSIILEGAGSGGRYAAPIAKSIFKELIK